MELNLAMNFKNQAIQMVVIDSECITKVDILDSLAASLHSTTALATSAGIFGPSRIPLLTVVLLTGPDEKDFKVLLDPVPMLASSWLLVIAAINKIKGSGSSLGIDGTIFTKQQQIKGFFGWLKPRKKLKNYRFVFSNN